MINTPFGQVKIELPEVDSTNSYAARLLDSEQPVEGTVIMAHAQRSGRGQRGSVWESEPHSNLLISYIIYPRFLSADDHFTLNQVLCLSIHEFVNELVHKNVSIKWPNDIMVGNSKIAGLLVETVIRGNKIHQCIAGIGINVNQVTFMDYVPQATSLALLTNKKYELNNCLLRLNIILNKWYAILAVGNRKKIRESYALLLYRKGLLSWYETGKKRFRGTIQTTMPQGELVIIQEDGFEYVFKNKEVKYLYENESSGS
jgi:BirA family transcriptional regulator, biotin operon repressor / biotin---[acetyl-CoA-carboxylase] ligase